MIYCLYCWNRIWLTDVPVVITFYRLTVTDEVLPATPSSSSDEEEGSLTSIGVGGDEEMEPIKEEPEEEEKEELEDSRHVD